MGQLKELVKFLEKGMIEQPEYKMKRLSKEKYIDKSKKGSKFRFCGQWKFELGEANFITNNKFEILEKGKDWEKQVAKLKEQGYREVVSCG